MILQIDRYNQYSYRGVVMNGKVTLITDANGRLGSQVTQTFLDAGRTIADTSRNIKQTDFAHPAFTTIVSDITTARNASELIEQVMALFRKLDVLVHTVGEFADGQSVIDTNDATIEQIL